MATPIHPNTATQALTTPPGPPEFHPSAHQFAPGHPAVPVGQYVPVGQPVPGAPGSSKASIGDGLSVVVYIASALKGLALLAGVAFGIYFAAIANDVDGTLGLETTSIAVATVVVTLIFGVIGTILLVGQVAGALRKSRPMLLAAASIMAALDVLFAGWTLTNFGEEPGLAIVLVIAAITQIGIVVGTVLAKR